MASENKSKVSILTNGIIKENPVLRLVLGTCSCLAVTTAVSSALGMGAAFTFVLVCSNILISLLRNVIPAKVHLPCYIVIIAGFVTIVQMVMHAYMDSLYTALGVFLPLIVVNCIILGRAEMFACKNNVVDSALDGVGMGIGYTLTVVLMATIREVLGSGTWLGFQVLPDSIARISIMTQAPYKCAVLPLSKKLGEKAMEIRNELSKYFMVDYDDTGSIGKRYRREDEIGTPYCITVDFDTVGDEAKGIAADNCVTVRDRDTMEQVRMPISELKSYIESKIEF